jgi:hypothetical protein
MKERYKDLCQTGKVTRSAAHCLSTSVLKETFTRNDQQRRQIIRVYCVQWLPRSCGESSRGISSPIAGRAMRAAAAASDKGGVLCCTR